MEAAGNFQSILFEAVDSKAQWFDSVELPKLLNEYRIVHSTVSSLFGILVKKGIVVEDPYKLEKKISDIIIPPDTPYTESERNVVLGTRLSDFDSMLDFLCNYFKFSVEYLSIDRIKSLVGLNNCFAWHNLAANSAKPNTQGLAVIVMLIRQGTDTLSIGMINDCVTHIAKSIGVCTVILKKLTEFQKEMYKIEIRKIVMQPPLFDLHKCEENINSAMPQIKKIFPQTMVKKPFYTELVEEIIQEEFGPDKLTVQAALLEKLEVPKKKEIKQEQVINPKDMLMEGIRTIGSTVPQFEELIVKIEENRKTLQNQDISFGSKFFALLKKAFNLQEKEIIYILTIVDQSTQTQKQSALKYLDFLTDLNKRSRMYGSFSVKKSQGYAKIEALRDDQVLEFLIKQIAEIQQLLSLLTALDDYFKASANADCRSKIKGIRIEISAIKNALVKANQRRGEYTSYKEELEQLKKMGIIKG